MKHLHRVLVTIFNTLCVYTYTTHLIIVKAYVRYISLSIYIDIYTCIVQEGNESIESHQYYITGLGIQVSETGLLNTHMAAI
jgi:hypothetical protein